MPNILVRKVNIATGEIADVEEFIDDVPAATPVLPDISRRQFYQALASVPEPYITEAEAVSAVASGTIPDAVETIVSGLPVSDQFGARMLLVGASTFERLHPLVGAFATALGMTDADLDAFWLAASKL